jgi:hypothetical protein
MYVFLKKIYYNCGLLETKTVSKKLQNVVWWFSLDSFRSFLIYLMCVCLLYQDMYLIDRHFVRLS